MQRIFVAGNPLLQEDSIALKVAAELRKKIKGVQFKEITSLTELDEIPKEFILLDAAKGIERVEKITDLSRLEKIKLISLHDFDIATELLLYKKLGKVRKVVIIAIPLNYKIGKAAQEVMQIVKSISLSKSVCCS